MIRINSVLTTKRKVMKSVVYIENLASAWDLERLSKIIDVCTFSYSEE
jgi:hypothetical protein